MQKQNVSDSMSEDTRYGRDLFLMGKQIHGIINTQFLDIDLGNSQGIQLLIIHHNPGIEMNQLKEIMAVDKATITKLIQKLVRKGYVKKEVNENDKRRFSLFLTKKGEEKTPVIQNKIQFVNDIIVSGFSNKEKNDLLVLLEKVRMNLSKIEVCGNS